MIDYRTEYEQWLEKADEATRTELENLSDNEIKDRFYRHL